VHSALETFVTMRYINLHLPLPLPLPLLQLPQSLLLQARLLQTAITTTTMNNKYYN